MSPKEKQIISVIAAVVLLAGGYVWATKYRTTPPPSPSPQGGGKEETGDWKTYSNDKYGFEVKIPADWTVDSSSANELFFYSAFSKKENEARTVRCSTVKLLLESDIMECSQRNLDMYFSTGTSGSNATEKEIINGIEWLVTEGQNAGWRYESKHNGNVYAFKLTYLPENKAKLVGFLSTFKF